MIWWQHLQTFLWLRWRIGANARRRASKGSVIVEWIFSMLSIFSAGVTFVGGLSVGIWVMPQASAAIVMLVWDGLAAGFMLFWLLELINELQRSEVLSLEKFLHLPVSLSSVFLINYVSSLYCMSMTIFFPAMIGLSIGLVFSKGPVMLALFPVVAAFFLMVTALTHQFRGWLASLMENKRRRRTIITLLTVSMVLLFQLPNLLTFGVFGRGGNSRTSPEFQADTRKIDRLLATHQIDRPEYERQSESIRQKYGVPKPRSGAERLETAEQSARIANMVIPLGWLPYGALTTVEGRILPAMLATLGLALIGLASLKRSYSTTMRLYTGTFTSGKPHPVTAEVRQEKAAAAGPAVFFEKQLPWISEQASAITVACFRSLVRAPEAKMMLLTPLIFVVAFGSTFLRVHSNPTELLRPIMAAAVMGMIFLGLAQLAGNQFGFDRSGFRVFVLSGSPRKDILLGKNLALLPFALGLGTIGTVVLQIAYPMQMLHFLAAMVQMISMYLIFCFVHNFLSILAPMAIASGSLKPHRPKGMAILVHILFFFFLLPLSIGTTLIPLGIEFLFPYLPAYFLLTLAECALVLYLYPRALVLQARLLQTREQRILEIVAAKVE